MATADVEALPGLCIRTHCVGEFSTIPYIEWVQAPRREILLRWQPFANIIKKISTTKVKFTACHQVPELWHVYEPPDHRALIFRFKLTWISLDTQGRSVLFIHY